MTEPLREILAFIRQARGKRSQDEFAQLLGGDYSRRQVSGYERGEMAPPADYLLRVARVAGVSLDILSGIGSPVVDAISSSAAYQNPISEDFVLIPRYDVEASAGDGALVHDENVVDWLSFKRSWIIGEKGWNPNALALIHVRGDSMLPTLESGDLVLVNTAQTKVHGGGLYVIRLGTDLMSKRLQRVGTDQIKVISDNRDVYEPFTVSLVDGLTIVGEIVWFCREMK